MKTGCSLRKTRPHPGQPLSFHPQGIFPQFLPR